MYITKKINKSVALVHKILRIKGNPQCCSFVSTFVFEMFQIPVFETQESEEFSLCQR